MTADQNCYASSPPNSFYKSLNSRTQGARNMADFIGVSSWLSILANPKRDMLMFDRVAIPLLGVLLNAFETSESKLPKFLSGFQFPIVEKVSEIRWLMDSSLIFDPQLRFDDTTLNNNPEFRERGTAAAQKLSEMKTFFETGGVRPFVKFIRSAVKGRIQSKEDVDDKTRGLLEDLLLFTESLTRLTAIQFRELENINAYPVVGYDTTLSLDSRDSKTDVVQIVLGSLPIPNDETPWEHILEYRSDEDSRNKFLDLRHWMSDVARGQLTTNEIQEKLEWLMSQYQRHMQLHKMKTNSGALEIVLVTTSEVLEDLAHLKFSAATKAIFSFRQRRISLMEGELTSPGSEVAYIIKTRESFS